jgi:CheY-like chemotaxis protein
MANTAMPLRGRRVLIVEDEVLIAMELESLFRAEGCEVLGPVNSVARALGLIESRRPDVAVLDLNLGGDRGTPVARALASENVPFIVVSGYSDPVLDEPELRAAPRLLKPFRHADVVRLAGAALQRD